MTDSVVVIGAGAIGATAAYELAQAGHRVTLLERAHAVGLGSSAGTAGLLATSHAGVLATPQALREGILWMTKRESPFYVRPSLRIVPWLVRFARAALKPEQVRRASDLLRTLSRDSLSLHAELLARGIPTTLEQRGVLYTYESEAGFEHARAALPRAAELGLTVQALTVAEAKEFEPAVSDALAGAVYSKEEAHLDSLRYVEAVAAAAQSAGAELRLNTEVVGFRSRDGRIADLHTTTGSLPLAGATVVLAAGVWSRGLGRRLGLPIPLEGAKGYHVELPAADGDPRLPIYMHESRVIATPYPGRLRLAGTLELAGDDASIDEVRLGALQKAAARNLDGLEGRDPVQVWRGFRPTPPDGMPLLGRSRAYANLVLATGHAMTGVALSPVMANLVRELVEGTPPSYDLSLLDPDRFRGVLR
jgi:D-amino-acid dehydrogenase